MTDKTKQELISRWERYKKIEDIQERLKDILSKEILNDVHNIINNNIKKYNFSPQTNPKINLEVLSQDPPFEKFTLLNKLENLCTSTMHLKPMGSHIENLVIEVRFTYPLEYKKQEN